MKLVVVATALALVALPAHAGQIRKASRADPVREATQRELPSLMALYRDLHASPELSSF